MAQRRRPRRSNDPASILPPARLGVTTGPETTGRYIVVFKNEGREPDTMKHTLERVAGIAHVASVTDYASFEAAATDLATARPTMEFPNLGVAVVEGEDAITALQSASAGTESPIAVIEPEYVAYLSSSFVDQPWSPMGYLRGYRDAVNHLYDQLTGRTPDAAGVAESELGFADTPQITWGLQACAVDTSPYSGRGIKVAVLDTGFDLDHPDFVGRVVVSQSFSGATFDDVNGHGTHCIGTACGPDRPPSGVRRYGIAHNAQIYAGKVFDNAPRPRATTSAVLAGIEWALANQCAVVSLSLGIPINQKVQQYETPLRRALNLGTLIVAAAGNNAARPQDPGFVEPPANAEAAMAVAAVDELLAIASFSGRSSQLTGDDGKVNIAAPGVGIYSCYPVAGGSHRVLQGTSMATPHVAGIAALWAEATGERGPALWGRLIRSVRPLQLPSMDVGAGLAQAPQQRR